MLPCDFSMTSSQNMDRTKDPPKYSVIREFSLDRHRVVALLDLSQPLLCPCHTHGRETSCLACTTEGSG